MVNYIFCGGEKNESQAANYHAQDAIAIGKLPEPE
jgi:hypothetical protein